MCNASGTTDAIFLEKPSYYDLVIDLTTSTPSKATRPTLHSSREIQQPPGSRGPSHRLSVVRWTWSDIKLVRFNSVNQECLSDSLCSGTNLTGFFDWIPTIRTAAAVRLTLEHLRRGQMHGVSTKMYA